MGVLNVSAERYVTLVCFDRDVAGRSQSSTGELALDLPRNCFVLNRRDAHDFHPQVRTEVVAIGARLNESLREAVSSFACWHSSKLMATLADDSPSRNLAIALRAGLEPRFVCRGLGDFRSGGLASCAGDCVSPGHGALRMRARQRIRSLAAYRAQAPRGSRLNGNGFSFAHGAYSPGWRNVLRCGRSVQNRQS